MSFSDNRCNISDSTLPARWEFRKVSHQWAGELARELDLTPLAARILAGRVSCVEAARRFLQPGLGSLINPFLMADMDKAVERISRAIDNRESIAIYGDYDVDGLSATGLLVRFFRWLGIEPDSYVPHRLNEGYGLNRRGIDILAARKVRLIVTVDNGITSLDEVEYAASLGIDVVVTDHHEPGAALPAAAAVVDPKRSDCSYPFKGLSGVGVAFKLAHAVAKGRNVPESDAKEFLKSVIDLVALGTIADIVPVVDENRALVSYGLKALARTDKPGLRAMIDRLGLSGRDLTGERVGYLISPRLNAAGRMQDPHDALRVLLSDDAEESRHLAQFLDDLNEQRKRMVEDTFADALSRLSAPDQERGTGVVVVAGEGWHQGVLGIVASRLVDHFNRPAVVLSLENGTAKGSARSTPGFDIHGLLGSCSHLLTAFGGHKMAAGLTLEADRVGALQEALWDLSLDHFGNEHPSVPPLFVETEAQIPELTFEAIAQIGQMQPFGEGNQAPVIAIPGCRLEGSPRIRRKKHLKIRFSQATGNGSLEGIFFGAEERYDALLKGDGGFDVAGVPMVNEWNGQRSIEMVIKDIRSRS